MPADKILRPIKPLALLYRDYRPGDEGQIAALMAPYWKRIYNASDWTHEFIDSPDGPCISRVCEVNGRIIAHDGLILMQMSLGSQKLLCAKSEGTIVSVEFRRSSPRLSHLSMEDRSIFEHLARQKLEIGMTKGIDLAWGFPNEMSRRGFVRAGWGSLALHERSYMRPVSIADTARLLAKVAPHWCRALVARMATVPLWLFTRYLRPLKTYPNARVVPVKEFDERIDRFWQNLAQRHSIISINRTSHHLNWRFSHQRYIKAILVSESQLAGYAIGILEDKQGLYRLHIIDLVVGDSFFSFLGQLIDGLLQAAESKVDYITINCFSQLCKYGNQLNSELKKYFIPAVHSHSQAFILKVNPLCGGEDRLMEPTRWFISDIFRDYF